MRSARGTRARACCVSAHVPFRVSVAAITFVVSHLQLCKVVPKHAVVCIIAVVVGGPALLC
jgi:hypothetical protein